ncbi:SDR family NAD(P)-dependent oxidoreductase [Roseomonas sp. BN140053]|uniref:SDR family NAD(P)-dependent oxidoreductase n=1 Tax=Roseomonas sp. BN140053 TaxID=3391898 RepID=UPI0039EA49CC
MDVNGISALVTGGGSGLGAATAEALARAGARVVVMDRNAEAAQSVAARIGGTAIPGDVTRPEDVQAAVDAASALGPLRLAVSCAGIAPAARVLGRNGPHDLELFSKVVGVNLVGTFNTLRLAAARMAGTEPLADNERGLIINTASVAAFEGQGGQCAYAASKGGVAALTLPAARDLARSGIRVLCLAPGLIHTPLMDTLTEEARASLTQLPLFPKRLGRPDEFGALVLSLCANTLMNGETIRIDGGLRLPPQ